MGCSSQVLILLLLATLASAGVSSNPEIHVRSRALQQQVAPAPATGDNSSLILAQSRTTRHDPLNSFNKYRGGWNIRSKHYWASVGFTGLPGFVLALLWLAAGLVFALSLCLYCCCCRPWKKDRYNHGNESNLVPLILLSFLSIAAVAGCVLVYFSQAKFHDELSDTLKYVVQQSQTTVENLQNVSTTLQSGASISIFNNGLPNDEKQRIQQISDKLNSTSVELDTKTRDNAHRIRKVINNVRLAMIIVSAVMLLVVLIGLLLTACGLRWIVYLLVIIGWALVIGTWILCGIFILLNNVMGDTCVAMGEWVQNPDASTNLDDILPCVNQATANQTLLRSKEVTGSVVSVVNRAVNLVLNSNNVPGGTPLNFNQSGPTIPSLCSPYGPAPDYNDVQCSAGAVSLAQAPASWSRFICQESNGQCITPGRMTPEIYNQIIKAVNVSNTLFVNVPFLINVQNCEFVRETFQTIIDHRCPDLRKYTRWIYIGLALVSSGVMLSIVFWIITTRIYHHRHAAGYRKNDAEKAPYPHPT